MLRDCSSNTFLYKYRKIEVSSLQLGVLHINSTINTDINFQGSTTNYKS